MNMEVKTTIYDIFGYLVSGIVAQVAWLLAYEHSTGGGLANVRTTLSHLANTEIILILILAYLLGHGLSSISSLVIEKPVYKLRPFRGYHGLDQIMSAGVYSLFLKRFQSVFDCDLTSPDFRLCVCYAESKVPRAYQTAFVFLAFYGMARNTALVLMSYGIWEAVNAILLRSRSLVLWGAAGLVFAFLFSYHYLRFLRYFRQEIAAAFLVGSLLKANGETDEADSTDRGGPTK